MADSPNTRLPSDPLHPDHEMYQRLLTGVQDLHRGTPEQNANLAAALYADVRTRQPHMAARDIGQVVAGDPNAPHPSVFAVPRAGYHTHDPDPAALRFGAPLDAASRPAQQSLAQFGRETTIGQDGFLTDPGITRTPVAKIEHGAMPQVNGIVLHRTESSTAAGTLDAWRTRADATGAHFLIDKDGTIHQTVSVDRQAWHVGPVRSRGEVEGTITPRDQREIDAARGTTPEWRGTAVRAVNGVESTRPYPERYPTNGDSVGIEVVGRYNAATHTWDAPTAAQTASIQRLVGTLQNNFGLNDHDVYQHDVISRKTPGEGAGLTRLPCLLLLPMLLACHPQARPDSGASDLTVLEISKAVYAPAQGSPSLAREEAMCGAWSLDKRQAEAFFGLSKELREGELHDYDWLPCSIKGRVQAKGRVWEFEINAAGTSTWRNGDEALMLGCSDAACEPFVVLMPDIRGQ